MPLRDTTIKDNTITILDGADYHRVVIKRLSRRQQRRCDHEFRLVALSERGHGGWRHGCRKCGALIR